jgi:hypothetical protein
MGSVNLIGWLKNLPFIFRKLFWSSCSGHIEARGNKYYLTKDEAPYQLAYFFLSEKLPNVTVQSAAHLLGKRKVPSSNPFL